MDNLDTINCSNYGHYLIPRFQQVFTPSRQNCGQRKYDRLQRPIVLPSVYAKKPQKWGMKAWALADSRTGYIWNWKLYTGKDDDADRRNLLGERVVLDLTKNLWHKGYHLYSDNFYTSPALCSKLYDHGMGSCGTARLNRRGIPKPFQEQKLKRGEVTSFQSGVLTGIKWMDKRPVTVLSTVHDTSMTSISRRNRQATGGIENIEKPTMIAEYNTFMGGVDKADQLVTYYGFSHHSKKWWKRAFFHLLDTTIVNAYLLYCSTVTSSQRLSHVDFRLSVAAGLIEKSEPPPVPQSPYPQDASHLPAQPVCL